MSAPYSSVTVSGYASNPPADDGSAVSTNQIKFSTVKTKLSDPLNTAVAAINSGISTAFGKVPGGASLTSTGVSLAITSSHQGQLVRATASGITLTFPDATSVGTPFLFRLLNSSSGNITLAGAGGQTINGSTSLTMAAGDGYYVDTDGSNWFVTGRKTGVLGRGYIDGCTMANGADATNDITIAAGVVRDSTNTVDITVAAMTTGKQLDANWAPGDAAGMRNSAAGIANSTYHVYAVAKADGTQDIYAHTSTTVATVITALQAETGGASYVYARRIGSIIRTAGSIVAFSQVGDEFLLSTASVDVNATNPGTASVLRPVLVPAGIKATAILHGSITSSTPIATLCYINSPSMSDEGAATTRHTWKVVGASGSVAGGELRVRTDTSSQVRTDFSASDGNVTLILATLGWIDTRGKDS